MDGPVWTGRLPANAVPKSTYYLPDSDCALPDEVQEWLRTHPMAYAFPAGDAYRRCPTCEQWTGDEGCDVRKLAISGDLDGAHKLHDQREWPAGTGKATTTLRGMTPDYSCVTFAYRERP